MAEKVRDRLCEFLSCRIPKYLKMNSIVNHLSRYCQNNAFLKNALVMFVKQKV